VASGVLRPGDEVQVLPERPDHDDRRDRRPARPGATRRSRRWRSPSAAGRPSTSPRATLICRRKRPARHQDVDALVCWMADEPLRPRQRLAIKHTTRTVRGMVKELQYRLDVNTLHREPDAGELGLNDIGRVRLRTTSRCSSTTTRATGSPAGSS
jgi:sulfate adenylyltransferase subunit 1 (EFTu-like GTPase family)